MHLLLLLHVCPCVPLQNNAVITARFLEIRLATLPMAVSPAVIAEVVGVKKPITNRDRDPTKVGRGGVCVCV